MSFTLFCVFVLLGSALYVKGQYYSLTTSDRYAIVGSPFTFTCEARFPFSEVIWSENNTEYMMHERGSNGQCYFHSEHPEEYLFNCSDHINTLTIKSVKLSQHGTVWRCGDYRPDSNEVKLEVRGGPGTSLKLNTSSVVTAVEGSDVIVSCSATCFITCNYQWKVADDVISNTSILSLADINRSQTGLYVCTAENPDTNQTANKTLHLTVHYGPGTSLKLNTSSFVTAVEGSDVTVSCSATCFISCNYQWKVADDVISTTSILSLADINRSQRGLYVCTAENPDTKQTAKKPLHLSVHYGPGSSLRVNSSSDITVEEGSDVTISCKAECFVKCLYRWELTNQIVSNNGLLALTNITRFQDGVYTCIASNPDTNQTSQTKIIINIKYQPSIKSKVIIEHLTNNARENKLNATFVCNVDSNPNSAIKILKGRQLLQQVQNATTLEYSWIVTSCSDWEGFYCEAENKVKTAVRKSLESFLLCPAEDSSQFGKGFGSGFGTFLVLSVIIVIVVVLYVRNKRRKEEAASNLERMSSNQPVYYNVGQISDNQTATAGQHQDTGSPYCSLEERRNDVPYDVIKFENKSDPVHE